MTLAARGSYTEACQRARAAVGANPENAAALDLLARLLVQLGKANEALGSATRAVALEPANANYRYTLGRVHDACEDPALAILEYQQVLRLAPTHVRAHVSLGVALGSLGRHEEAASCHRRALALDPGNAEASVNLAHEMARQVLLLREAAAKSASAGRALEALERLADAQRIAPHDAAVFLQAAQIQHSIGKLEEALAACVAACRLQPQWVPALRQTSLAAITCGEVDLAREYAHRASALEPSDGDTIASELALPAICDSAQQIAAVRDGLAATLDRLLACPLSVGSPETHCPLVPGFFLAYHGANNRDLKEKIARVFLEACPDLQWNGVRARRPLAGRRLRIGFASRFLCNHSIGKTSRGLMARLSRERFEVVAVRIPPAIDDETSRWIARHSDETFILAPELDRARRQIADLQLDVLFYQDIGMEALSYFLAFARLAPVQCLSFGHPDTTGIPNMDFFISNDAYELPGAQAHYSERLFLLRDLPTLAYYYRPPLEQSRESRESLGLDAGDHVYLCPQTLFKLHPDFDPLLAGILRQDPRGRVVLIRNLVGRWATQLDERFARSMPDVADRITFMSELPYARFLGLLATADVVLDTVHFNGMNSSLEAFAAAAPVVTLPGSLQRGRHTAAMYRAMGMSDCVASSPEDYVAKAVRLGTDPQHRHAASARISASSGALFENERVVAEFERFFIEAVTLERRA